MAGIFIIQTTTVVFFSQRSVLVTKQGVFLDAYILANEISLEQGDIAQHFIFTVGKFPVPDHDIQPQQVRCLDHINTAGPQ